MRVADSSWERVARVDEFMYPTLPDVEGVGGRPIDSKPENLAQPGYEPDWISLVRDLFKHSDPIRLPSAADLVQQSRPLERTLYRRLCRLYQTVPDESKFEFLP